MLLMADASLIFAIGRHTLQEVECANEACKCRSTHIKTRAKNIVTIGLAGLRVVARVMFNTTLIDGI